MKEGPMSLSDLASLGSFVSGLAVLVSLIFLYFQLRQLSQQARQSEKNQQALVAQERANRSVQVILSSIEPSLSAVFEKGINGAEDISVGEWRAFSSYWRAGFLGWEDSFYQHRDGLFIGAAYHAWEVYVRSSMKVVGTRALWRHARAWNGPEFVAWMDKVIAETPLIENAENLEIWRNDVRAERSGTPY
jgi:hypothetical protein